MSTLPIEKPRAVQTTAFAVLFSISFCHLLNDMMQSLLPAIYPQLKSDFHLNFTQVGLVTLAFQVTASLLQPVVGLYADRRPMPYSLPVGMVFTLAGLVLLAFVRNYPSLLLAASLIGMGSSVFHPESSRVARMAAGGRHGLAQSLFQVGGNIGSALGPISAAFIVLSFGQRSIAWFSLMALVAIGVLYTVGRWYARHGLAQLKHAARNAQAHPPLPRAVVSRSIAVLLLLIFSKYVYMASLQSYYTFYLIHHFHVSVRAAQVQLFVFLAAVAVGTVAGGAIGDRFGRKQVIWFSILGVLPFTLALPYVDLFWTGVVSVFIGLILASAFSAIVVYGQELVPGRVGMIAGMFFGFAFGVAGIGAAALGKLADATSIEFVYKVTAFLPAIGVLAGLLPNLKTHAHPIPDSAGSPMLLEEEG
ncbi:MAG: MFS transporter [Caulobacteraceae bacterium]|nr:MFS transporter [Caulobacteraceae bacterium]